MRVAQALKLLIEPLLPGGSAVRRIPLGLARGVRMEIDFSFQSRLYFGIFEIELAPTFRALCRPGTDCFDVGAREGYFTLALAKLSAGGRVLAFEVDPTWCAALRRNIDANPLLVRRPEVRLAHVAASTNAERGDVTLDDAASSDGGFVPDLIKIDIEGGELRALQGAERILGERAPHVVVETHSLELESRCAELLAEHGYRPRVVKPRRWLPEVRTAPHNCWLIAEGAPRGRGPRRATGPA
jgi:precorrin-6B methylase 2